MRNDCDLPYVRWEDFQGSDIYLLVFQLLGLHSLCYVHPSRGREIRSNVQEVYLMYNIMDYLI